MFLPYSLFNFRGIIKQLGNKNKKFSLLRGQNKQITDKKRKLNKIYKIFTGIPGLPTGPEPPVSPLNPIGPCKNEKRKSMFEYSLK